jgi:hypothetical protein
MRDFDLFGKIDALLPYYKLEYYNFAVNGANIVDIRDMQLSDALTLKPDMFIMFWDSDCSDVDENKIGKTEVRANYTNNLNFVVDSIVASGAYLALGGPAILGSYWIKTMMLIFI